MKNRVAIVTGASSGIGLSTTQQLLAGGYRVIAVARRISQTAQLRESEALRFIDGDVGDEKTAERAVTEAERRFEGLDLLVNNAGIFISKPFTRYTQQDFESIVSTNLFGFFSTTQKALPLLVRSGGGHVVNISTSLTVQPFHDVPSALPVLIKGGIEAATRSLAIEYAKDKIRVNTVSPGIIDTPMHSPKNHPFLTRLSPTGRLGTPREIADAVLFLDGAEYITGEIIRVDGGAHAGKWS